MFIGHLSDLFCEMPVQVFCPILKTGLRVDCRPLSNCKYIHQGGVFYLHMFEHLENKVDNSNAFRAPAKEGNELT